MNYEATNYYYKKYRRQPKLSKYDVFKESLKTIGREYCNESSICGLKHLVDESTPFIERLIWKIILIGAMVGSVSLVWITFQKYYFAPLVTTQMPEGISVNEIIFPAVGICSTNRISKRAAQELAGMLLKEERNSKYSEKDMLSMLFGLGQLYDFKMYNDRYNNAQLHDALGDYDVNELMMNLTPRCEDILIRCAWNEIPKNCSDLFDFRLTMNGYCCTFNYLRQSDVFFIEKKKSPGIVNMYNYGNKSSFDYEHGLKILLRLNESDDFYYNLPLQGAQLQFSDAYDFPDSPSGSYAMQMISPKSSVTVLINPSFTEASRDIQHVPVSQRQCLFYDESSYLPFYTHSDCMLKCRMLFLLDKCNCTPFNMPKMQEARTCDITDVACLNTYYAQSIAVRPINIEFPPAELELEMVGGGIDCPMCYPTCSKTAYGYLFDSIDIYPEMLDLVPDSDTEDWLLGANFTSSSLVHVKYGREVADCYGQNVIMKWFDLISNIGSTCGVLTGFSFVSVLEFIYFFTVKFARQLETRRKQNTVKSMDNVSVTQLAGVTRYRQIYWNELGPKTRNVEY